MSGDTYTSDLARSLAEGLLDRFQRYVRIDTQSRRDRTGSPSSPGQLELGRLLVAELRDAGIADADQDENGYVMATLPATTDPAAPVVGLIAHLDTSPDAPGAGVEPVVHRGYDGGVIELPRAGTRLDPAALPALGSKLGHDIVSASGDTLLGADDKAGVAEIMTAVLHLSRFPDLPRPTLRVCFTPDEEIRPGAPLLDLQRFGALCAYTLDGSERGELQDESFSADEVVLEITGVEAHPGAARGRMVNALRLAALVVAELPRDHLTPETTSGREGFIHPYELTGTVSGARLRAIVRDFDDARLAEHGQLVRAAAERVIGAAPGARYEVQVRHQYRNMRGPLQALPFITRAAEAAMRAEGITPVREPIRGGTDGSLLSARGLPTPNLFTGGHDFHSVHEWASLQDMAAASAMIVRLAGVWADPGFAARARSARQKASAAP